MIYYKWFTHSSKLQDKLKFIITITVLILLLLEVFVHMKEVFFKLQILYKCVYPSENKNVANKCSSKSIACQLHPNDTLSQ